MTYVYICIYIYICVLRHFVDPWLFKGSMYKTQGANIHGALSKHCSIKIYVLIYVYIYIHAHILCIL